MSTIRFTTLVLALGICGGMLPKSSAQVPIYNPEAGKASADQIVQQSLARLEFRPSFAAVSTVVTELKKARPPSLSVAGKIDGLVAEANGLRDQGQTEQASLPLYHAIALLLGKSWSEENEFASALSLKLPGPVCDREHLMASLQQGGGKSFDPHHPLQLELSLERAPDIVAVNVVHVAGPKLYTLSTVEIDAAKLATVPADVSADLSPVAEGRYLLVAEIKTDGVSLTRLAAPLAVVFDYRRRRATVEGAVSHIDSHPEAKATILYPFALVDGMAAGKREVLDYDFPASISRSERLLASLKSGQDLIYQATGDVSRAYIFPSTGELVPYRIFVPSEWRPGKKLPVIVALHGSNLDENNFLSRAGGLMEKLAEKSGYIVVCPLGYRMNSRYGAPSLGGMLTAVDGTRAARSEEDVLNVTALVVREYGGDSSRLYLMGNSMGGMGTYHIAAKYPQMWAAVAPCAAGDIEPDADVLHLRTVPLLTVTGTLDIMQDPVIKTVARLRQLGISPQLIDVPGGTHGSSIETAFPRIFEFFGKHHSRSGDSNS